MANQISLATCHTIMPHKQRSDFEQWLGSDNVSRLPEGQYITQCTQWKCKFSLEELEQYFLREFKS